MGRLSMVNDSNLRMAFLLEDYIDFINETGLQEAFKIFQQQKAQKQASN